MGRTSDYPLVIVGAGAAGLGASLEATQRGIPHLVLEASHRIGGRGLTETLDGGIPVDLGCHWMHCASINPFVEMARVRGFRFRQGNPDPVTYLDGEWQAEAVSTRRWVAYDRLARESTDREANGVSGSLWDCVTDGDPDLDWLNYWTGLMHAVDLDQVSTADVADFHDTGEDWPVASGYGALIAAVGSDAPVRLNCPLEKVRWNGDPVLLETPAGTIRAGKLLLTVSTGILNAGNIDFQPALPRWKQDALSQLPLGDCNYVFFPVTAGSFREAPESLAYQRGETCALVRVRPQDMDYVVVATGGRFAWWMEKQGEDAACQWFVDILQDIFGTGVTRSLGRGKASAWGYDPWIRGAYSARSPGAGDVRRELARPVDERLWFAGEATSANQFCTAHGAWISGRDAVRQISAQLV